MMIKELNHATSILSMIASVLERWNISNYQRESIHVFYLLLRVWTFLKLGQVKMYTSAYCCSPFSLWKGTHLYGVLMQQFLMIEINIFCS